MTEHGLREGSVSAGLEFLQEVKKREAVCAVGLLHLSLSRYSSAQWLLAHVALETWLV